MFALGIRTLHFAFSRRRLREAANRIYNIGVRLFLILFLFLCLSGALLSAPAPPAQKKQPVTPPALQPGQEQLPIFRGGVTAVMAPVTVTNTDGDFVVDLKPEDFRLLDNDVRQQITVELTEMPLSLVILIGNSSRVEPLLPQVRKMGSLFTNLVIGENGEAAVIAFDHRVEVAQGFTREPERIEKVFKDLEVGGEQARLSDGIVRALTLLSGRPKERRKVIVAIAEGRDWGSETDLGFALREAQLGSISIYSVGLSTTRANLTRKPPNPGPSPFPPGATGTRPGFPPGAPGASPGMYHGDLLALLAEVVRGAKNILFDNPLEAYAQGTGAMHVGGFSHEAVERAVSRIGRELRSQYLVTYRPNNLNQPGYHTIKVTVDRPGVKVRTRPGYYYPGSGSIEAPPADGVPK